MYFNFGSSTDEMTENKMSLSLLIGYMDVLERKGFQTGIYRSTNIRLIKMYEKLGGKQLAEAVFELKGKSYPIFFASLDLTNPIMQKVL